MQVFQQVSGSPDQAYPDPRSAYFGCRPVYGSSCCIAMMIIQAETIKHNLRTSMNERTHSFIKIYLTHFILERVDVSVVCERWVERHILRERTSSSHILFQEPEGANACTPCKLVRDASDRLRVPRSTAILCTLSKSDRMVLITWSPSSYTPVRPECSDVLSYPWQLVKAYRITRNERKIHVICNITIGIWPP